MKPWMKGVIWFGLGVVAFVLVVFQILGALTGPGREAAVGELREQARKSFEEAVQGPESASVPAVSEEGDTAELTDAELLEKDLEICKKLEAVDEAKDGRRIAHKLIECKKCLFDLSEDELDSLAAFVDAGGDLFADYSLPYRAVAQVALDSNINFVDCRQLTWLPYVFYRYLMAKAVLDVRRGEGEHVFKFLEKAERLAPGHIGWTCFMADLLSSAAKDRESEEALLVLLTQTRSKATYGIDNLVLEIEPMVGIESIEHGSLPDEAGFVPQIALKGFRSFGGPVFNHVVKFVAMNNARYAAAMKMPFLDARAAIKRMHRDIDSNRLLTFFHADRELKYFWSLESNVGSAKCDVAIDMTRLAIVLEWYRDERGVYPGSLEGLAGWFPEGMPVDPFSGAGYAYSSDGETFRLSSVGPAQEDDKEEFGEIVWGGCH